MYGCGGGVGGVGAGRTTAGFGRGGCATLTFGFGFGWTTSTAGTSSVSGAWVWSAAGGAPSPAGAGIVPSGGVTAGLAASGVGAGVSVVCALAPAAPHRVSPSTSAPRRTRSFIFSPPTSIIGFADHPHCVTANRAHTRKKVLIALQLGGNIWQCHYRVAARDSLECPDLPR